MKQCIIFGTSATGKAAYYALNKKEYEVIGFSDNNKEKWNQEFCNRNIFPPSELVKIDNVDIIIASVWYLDIYKQLLDMGITSVKVIQVNVNNDKDDDGVYYLYDNISLNIFKSCIYDQKLINEIKQDYSNNYDVDTNTSEEISACGSESMKKVLFFAYNFPPIGGSGVQRSLKFVKYLRKFGFEPTVVTIESDFKLTQDETLLNDVPKGTNVIRIPSNVIMPELLTEKEQQEIYNLYAGIVDSKELMNEYVSIVDDEVIKLVPDRQIIWVNECLKNIDKLVNVNDYDVIYTTGNPFSTFIIGYYLKKKYEIPWVMDYRDPWMTNDYYLKHYYEFKRTTGFQRVLEEKLVEYSDKVIVVADGMIDEFVKKYTTNRLIFGTITNGYDEDDFSQYDNEFTPNEVFTICFSGTIYLDRNQGIILEAVNQLIDEGLIDKKKVRWVINGLIDTKWKNIFASMDKYNIVQCNGYRPHEECIRDSLSSEAMVLFGISGELSSIVYTGKVFEYIRMKRPIICFSDVNSVLHKMMEETGCGQNFAYDDINGAKKYIYELYLVWKKDKKTRIEENMAEINKYNRENETEQLAKIFDSVIMGGN